MTQTTSPKLDEAVKQMQSAITLIGVELTRHGRADEAYKSRQAFETILSALKVRTSALKQGETLLAALRVNGFPVSDEAWRKSSGSMSHQARALHLAATDFQAAVSALQDPEDTP